MREHRLFKAQGICLGKAREVVHHRWGDYQGHSKEKLTADVPRAGEKGTKQEH